MPHINDVQPRSCILFTTNPTFAALIISVYYRLRTFIVFLFKKNKFFHFLVAFPFRLIVFEEENGPNGGGLGFEGCERSEFCELGTCDVNSFCTIFADI